MLERHQRIEPPRRDEHAMTTSREAEGRVATDAGASARDQDRRFHH